MPAKPSKPYDNFPVVYHATRWLLPRANSGNGCTNERMCSKRHEQQRSAMFPAYRPTPAEFVLPFTSVVSAFDLEAVGSRAVTPLLASVASSRSIRLMS